ncbi:dTDP-4-dehydrorhamnose reductase [Kosakonia oryzendophytica]|uniref:dTDP-4-dehydrorhamnose reductase n=1 Tax=Kosakonia TaxID=1330547 RepID=UPI0021D81E59|nr:dTDP-4-dehydrorhamnose reductase [Kosakonia sp. ML.JS2a]UXY12629.1 dTDP-4-dehydrorhamnose reductase [Kosakonia sp. ML.JS2a]
MRVLVIGCNGQVGSCLVAQLTGKAEILAVDRNQLDITDAAQVDAQVTAFKPDYILNAAAHTAVDKAEDDVEASYQINADGPKYLAIAADKIGAVLVHISTDYVFDGESEGEYTEDMKTGPQGVYGQSKLAGENAVAQNASKYLILRTAWVFGEHGSNFVKTMLRLAGMRNELNVVADQWGGPTYAGDIASAIISMIEQIDRGLSPEWGIYHYSGAPHTNWADFARAIFTSAVEHGCLDRAPLVHSIAGSEYPTRAKRPSNSRLNCQKIERQFGIKPSDWRVALNNIKEYK